jgi:hypothetical protein
MPGLNDHAGFVSGGIGQPEVFHYGHFRFDRSSFGHQMPVGIP